MRLLFTQVKSQVTTRQAAERYGVPVNRSGMACCPFHDDRHPSMKIDERFYCFGCHTTGDVIDFTAKLFDLSLYDATKKLANDFNIRPLPPGQSAPIPKLPAAVIERKEEQRVLKILIEYERLLEKWKEEFAPSDPEDDKWDDRFVHAVHHLPTVSDAIDRLFSSDPDERKAIMDHIRNTDAVAKIENILKNGISKEQTRRVCDAVPQNQQERKEHAQAQRSACEEMNDGPEKDRAA